MRRFTRFVVIGLGVLLLVLTPSEGALAQNPGVVFLAPNASRTITFNNAVVLGCTTAFPANVTCALASATGGQNSDIIVTCTAALGPSLVTVELRDLTTGDDTTEKFLVVCSNYLLAVDALHVLPDAGMPPEPTAGRTWAGLGPTTWLFASLLGLNLAAVGLSARRRRGRPDGGLA